MDRKTRLSETEIAAYKRDGYVIPDYRISDETLQGMRAAYERIIAANSDNPDVNPDFMLGPHLSNPGAQGVKGDPAWLDFARMPEIVDMVSQVAGDDLILWGTTLFGKPARTGKATPWHQDGDYYPIDPLETVTVWVALDDATPENGCMKFIPGSHAQRRIFPHHWAERADMTLYQALDDDYVDEDKAVDVELKAGQISLHDVYLVHGSRANTSAHRRAGFVLRIMPGASYYNHHKGEDTENPTHDYSKRALFVLKGEDKTGRNDFEIGH